MSNDKTLSDDELREEYDFSQMQGVRGKYSAHYLKDTDLMNVKASLREKLQQCQVAPFLFIGSGLSRRYLGLEMWADLLKVFTDETTSPFEYYLSSANDNLPQVATLLAKEYHELWWKNEKFRLSREANSIHAKSVDAALKIEISRYVEKKIENITTV